MKRKVKVGDHWEKIVYKGNNLYIQQIKEGVNKAVFIGSGHSIELDENNIVQWKDPGMLEFYPEIGKREEAIYTFYFVRKTARLEEASKELAAFINQMQLFFHKVILVGHSKAGICVENACKYTNRTVNVCISVSAPHAGTISASGKLFAEKLRNHMIADIYLKNFSDHQVDRDILPESQIIKNVKRPKCNLHINIVSVLELKTAWKSILDLGALWLDRRVGMYGDGIVSQKSQEVKWTDYGKIIHCSHARSLEEALKFTQKNVL